MSEFIKNDMDCPDCEPGKPCAAHLAALAELVARANAPEPEAEP